MADVTWCKAFGDMLVYASAGFAVVAGIVAVVLLLLWLTLT
jgi:hypothetical protein